MKISLLYKHTTTVHPARRAAQEPLPASVHVVYTVLDGATSKALECVGGRYLTEQLSSYKASDEEETVIYQLQRLVETRYLIRSRPRPNNSGNVFFEAVKILTFEREIGEIEWEPTSPVFASAIEENAELELE